MTIEWQLLATLSLMATTLIWLAQLILGNYKWTGTGSPTHRVLFNSLHEDCEPKTGTTTSYLTENTPEITS
ncbi:hypothetical protein JVT61DRAFT_13516 [Boletus reticuloceps]|uniref:Uncharacterized protein n=1 Tax=Boletus reticuloceps TaxID=495285 RepID=A0A8I2YDH0_9AGAM|nr:hypothetical protein JVT61DRAFT_13516 [Boletus reticuloceps]